MMTTIESDQGYSPTSHPWKGGFQQSLLPGLGLEPSEQAVADRESNGWFRPDAPSPFQTASALDDQRLDGIDEVGGVGGAGADLAQDAPVLQFGVGAFAGCTQSGVARLAAF
jgi:hypothetical protein